MYLGSSCAWERWAHRGREGRHHWACPASSGAYSRGARQIATSTQQRHILAAAGSRAIWLPSVHRLSQRMRCLASASSLGYEAKHNLTGSSSKQHHGSSSKPETSGHLVSRWIA